MRGIDVKIHKIRNIHWRRASQATLAAVALFAAMSAAAQDANAPQQRGQGMRGQFAGMQRVNGEVTAVNGPALTVKNEEGVLYQVTLTDNTRIMKGRGETIKAADLKVGDGLVAMGNLDAPNKTLHAAMIIATDAATLKALKDNLGKTYITGKVTAIDVDNAKMTVERPDKVAQTIGFDETTSFKRGGGIRMAASGAPGIGAAAGAQNAGESITLADIKVGDTVTGEGSLKSGVFVPTQLMVATPGQGARRNSTGRTPGTPPPPQ
jgi:hypothetical protein